jgi:hypothetical protein
MLTEECRFAKVKPQTQASIWKVFCTLLEYCQQDTYQAMISKLVSSHKTEIDEMKLMVESTKAKSEETQSLLNWEIDHLKSKNKDLEFTSQ